MWTIYYIIINVVVGGCIMVCLWTIITIITIITECAMVCMWNISYYYYYGVCHGVHVDY